MPELVNVPAVLIERGIMFDLIGALLLQKFQPKALLLNAKLIAQQAAAQRGTEQNEQNGDNGCRHILRGCKGNKHFN